MPPRTRSGAAPAVQSSAGASAAADVTCHRIALRDHKQHCQDERRLLGEQHQHQLRMTAMIFATVGILVQFVATLVSLGERQLPKGGILLFPLGSIALLLVFAMTTDFWTPRGLGMPAPAGHDAADTHK
jgi:hypothetical protein